MYNDITVTQNLQSLKEFTKDIKRYIYKNKLFVSIQGHAYVYVEGWQFIGGMLGIEAIPITLDNLSDEVEIKYSCTVELIQNERIVGRGFAICSNQENKKKTFDEYAIASMAQTRAVGKAYRLKIGWLMKLAGYESTPAEEVKMPDYVDNDNDKKEAIIDKLKSQKENK